MNTAYNRYSESNIPLEYWDLKVDDSFAGPKELKEVFNFIVSDIDNFYRSGSSLCFAGSHGIGKTLSAINVLKLASHKNYNCLYTTLSDIVSTLTTASNEDKFIARKELMMIDFLVIDEFDPRFMQTESAADLFGVMLENIFRTRSQNKLPTIMCTNSPNPVESFTGSIKQSISSLMAKVQVVSLIGQDFRKLKDNLTK